MDINAIRKELNQLQTTNTRTSNLWKLSTQVKLKSE